ncbi:NAD(P)H-dependent oxidoreductase [Ideonella azotifigens]|uniref:NAD(P)H-dependent oxidoreductase n=1 Tax=Ideonella azotifigens TaxID=513160 RepID=A0ABN1KKE2_9BURK|nr:NADPH-dependent FMN reductase [Ideonella azotifigens]MCD2339252.1 NAD(P)H-dependent oxidoreductase [Ideonella azotifigens]
MSQNPMQIAVILGSLRKQSMNRQLATALARLAPVGVEFNQLEIGDLPLYNQDDDAQQAATVQRFKAQVSASHGLLFVTPEYNRSIPGVLKNAIDHGSRPYGHSSWTGKPAGIVGLSPGSTGAAMAQQHLRNVLVAVGVVTLPQPEVFLQNKEGLFDANGDIGEASKGFLQGWMATYVGWVRQFAG